MRRTVTCLILLAMLSGVVTVAAADQLPATATLVVSPSGNSVEKPFTMGDTVAIKVEGGHDIKVADSRATGVWLVLDGVVMKSMGHPVAKRVGVGTDIILAFDLSRDPENEESRDEWKTLLRKQHDGYLMSFPIALAVGNSAALPVSLDGFKFYITTKRRVYSTLVGGLGIFGLMFWWLIRSDSALRDSPNGYYSLGKSQMAFWGLLVFISFAGVWINTGMIQHIPEQVLVLLGISGATGLSALVIGAGTRSAEIAKLKERLKEPPEPGSSCQDISKRLELLSNPPAHVKGRFFYDICDDGNGLSFHRLQTVMWTVMLGVIFVSDVARVISMPEFPETLLLLMGISNSIYLGFKFPEKV